MVTVGRKKEISGKAAICCSWLGVRGERRRQSEDKNKLWEKEPGFNNYH